MALSVLFGLVERNLIAKYSFGLVFFLYSFRSVLATDLVEYFGYE